MTTLKTLMQRSFAPDDGGGSGGGTGDGGDGGTGGAASPDFGSMMTDEAAFNSFRDALPDDMKVSAPFARLKSFEGLTKSYAEAQTLVGKDRIVMPDNPEDAAGWDQVYSKLGRPDDAAGYTIEPGDGQEFTDTDKAFHDHMRPLVHKAGLSQAQLDILGPGMTEFYQKAGEAQTSEQQRQGEQDLLTLDSELGGAKEEKYTMAKQAARALGVEKAVLDTLESKVGAAGLMRMFISIGEKMSPTGLKRDGDATPKGTTLTTVEAAAKLVDVEGGLAKLAKDFQGKAGLRKDPKYVQLMAERKALYAQKNPE